MPTYKDDDPRPFACAVDGCGHKFRTKARLTKHTRKEHRQGTVASRVVRIFPCKGDAAVLRRWIGMSRCMYNAAVDHINARKQYRYEQVREELTNEDRLPHEWLKMLPSAARKYAVMNACDAFKSNFAKRALHPGHRFEVRRRSKKSPVQQLTFEAKSLRVIAQTGCTGRLMLVDTRTPQLGRGGIAFDIRHLRLIQQSQDPILQMDKLGRFSLIIRHLRAPLETQERVRSSMVGLDPGIRTFMTTYSPDGTAYKLGDQAANRIYRLMVVDDKIQGRVQTGRRPDGTKMSKRERRNLRRSRVRLANRIDNLVSEMHWKVGNFLVTRYDRIVIPPFESARMSRRYEASRQRWRRIGKKTTRQMLRLRHYAFRTRLLYLAGLHGVQVDVMTEEYTSKTCTNCGHLHMTLGSNKVYRCSGCGVVYDRDLGGSRNQLLKNMEF